jgi:hypothetical protein
VWSAGDLNDSGRFDTHCLFRKAVAVRCRVWRGAEDSWSIVMLSYTVLTVLTVDSRLLRAENGLLWHSVCGSWQCGWAESQLKGRYPLMPLQLLKSVISATVKRTWHCLLLYRFTYRPNGRLLENDWNFTETCSSRTWDIKAVVCSCADCTLSLLLLNSCYAHLWVSLCWRQWFVFG